MPFHQVELQWIAQMQEAIRGPLLDQFFLLWRYVDTFGFTLVLVVAIWYCFSRPVGIRLVYTVVLAAVLNKFLKGFIGWPRPCQLEPFLGLYCPASPGMPSGGAQSAMILAGIAFLESKNRAFRIIAVIFALLLSFSRVYLGVHFVTDILGGWVVGAILLVVYAKVYPLAEKQWKRYLFLFPALLLFIAQAKVPKLVGYSVGIGIGLLVYEKCKKSGKQSWLTGFVQFLSVLAGECVILWLMGVFPKAVLFLSILAGFWLAFLGGYLVARWPKRA